MRIRIAPQRRPTNGAPMGLTEWPEPADERYIHLMRFRIRSSQRQRTPKGNRAMFDAFQLSDGTFAGFGAHVVNLTSINAVIVGEHFDGNGNRSPILRELLAPCVLSRAQWVADVSKCRKG